MRAYVVHTTYNIRIYMYITHIHTYVCTTDIRTYTAHHHSRPLSVCAHFVGFSSVTLGGDGGREGALAPKRFVVLDFATHGHIMLVLARTVQSAAFEQ